jgi:hypothetical protein
MNDALERIRAYWALGPASLARVGLYRLAVRCGVHPVQHLKAPPTPQGPFFTARPLAPTGLVPSRRWLSTGLSFGWHEMPLARGAPNWIRNPFTGQEVPTPERAWWRIPDFDPQVGDIKTIWEASRFDWLVSAAERAREGDSAGYDQIETWLKDWLEINPPYAGPNWKCGQEASIRVMHLSVAALVLDQVDQPTCGLLALLAAHLRRIAPTVSYAIGQDNNHGTSEAAALFIGGNWLMLAGVPEGRRWARIGRRLLENRAAHLIEADGSFSQYSTNYHRVMLDALSLAELWRRNLDLEAFTARFNHRAAAATRWLHAFVDPDTGRAPNIGANDGARLLPLTDTDQRDFRPALQLAAALFLGARSGNDPLSEQHLRWLGLDVPDRILSKVESRLFNDGGYALLRNGEAKAVLRFPRWRFRPSDADALHLDLWVDGIGLLRDGGSYSYNGPEALRTYFAGTAGHNTIQFDDRDQMPRVGRFLFGRWLKTDQVYPPEINGGMVRAGASYRDFRNVRHERMVELATEQLRVRDTISGFDRKAVLRWRLPPGSWIRTSNGAESLSFRVDISASMPVSRMEIVTGYESELYLKFEECEVLEVEVAEAGAIDTILTWRPGAVRNLNL